MCGIAGIFGEFDNKEHELNKMLSNLVHRGPDDKGTFVDHNCAVGMRRLSINDLVGGSQPLYNNSKSVIVTYNGEIYNSKELRNLLILKGYNLNSNSDGEVIPHLYDEFGERVFDYLDGMFAISIWDRNKKILFLGRDTAGEKPLYYSRGKNNLFIFSSEVKAFKNTNLCSLSFRHQSMWDFPTFLWVPEPFTIYNEIEAVPPGNYAKVSGNHFSLNQIFPNYLNENIRDDLKNDLLGVIRKTVEDSVTSRLLSDVPLGCFLSGGLDSTIVSTIASKHLPHLSTFNVSFENVKDPYHGMADESQEAENTAKRIGSHHHKINVTQELFYNDLKKFSYYGDQPYAVSSGLGIFSVSRAAKENGIKVLLSGDGADECFGGYSWYKYLPKIENNSELQSVGICSFQDTGKSKKQILSQINSLSSEEKIYSLHYYAHEIEKAEIFTEDFRDESIRSSFRHFSHLNGKINPKNIIRDDRNFYFPNEMLTKIDRMTMANSIEGRAPFASAKVLDLSDKISFENMIKKGQLKWCLREAFKDIIPSDVINRKKHGFNVPIDRWLKNEWSDLVSHTFSSDSYLTKNNIIKRNSLESVKKLINNKQRLNGHTIFSFIMLNMWLEN
ncbi:MAG: asparagine synthase (glutamine-hydrolyzing) [Candidatus Marinimicrobia bacterium]|nr:asparagine synthase (glutamine-hydrolyzing) [Candidatus Neomarinimicrobiota bacterium]